MVNFDDVVKENTKEHNPNWPQNSSHPYRMLIIGGSGSGKSNSLFNLLYQLSDIDNLYLNAKDSYGAKYQLLINKTESTGLNHSNDSKTFIKYSDNMIDIYINFEDYNPNKKRKILIDFDDIVGDMLSNKHFFCFYSTISFCCYINFIW